MEGNNKSLREMEIKASLREMEKDRNDTDWSKK
jgi:hypothetical protein